MSDRFGHVTFDDTSKALSMACRIAANKLEDAIDHIPFNRGKSNAMTKLEECVMWVNKALREAQMDRSLEDALKPRPTANKAVIIKKV